MRDKYIVMLGTSQMTRGGVAAAIRAYARSELFRRWPIVHVATHVDGSAWAKTKIAARAYARFLRLLLAGRVGMLHVHSASDASFWRKTTFMVPALLARRPVVFHLHGGGFMDFYGTRANAVGRGIIRLVLDRAARIVVLSEHWRDRVAAITSNRNIVVIPNMVDTVCRPRLASVGREELKILFLGRLEKAKGVYDLLDAFVQLQRDFPRSRLLLAGEGEITKVRHRARVLGVERSVDFLGWIENEIKIEVLADADVFALPSYIENMPVSLLEAMALGLPVVATATGGIPDVVVDGVHGILVEAGNASALAAALRRLAKDPALRRHMGEAGRRRIKERFATERVIPRLEAIYRDLGARPRTDARRDTTTPARFVRSHDA